MAVETLTGSRVMTGLASDPISPAEAGLAGGRVRYWSDSVEVSAGASAGSTYVLARLPSAARLTGLSTLHHDGLASANSATLDVGLFNPAGLRGITDDDDAVAADIALNAGAASPSLVGDPALMGTPLWSFVAGQSADPMHDLELRATLKDAVADIGGSLTIELFYTID